MDPQPLQLALGHGAESESSDAKCKRGGDDEEEANRGVVKRLKLAQDENVSIPMRRRKVCLICWSLPDEAHSGYYDIFIIDLSYSSSSRICYAAAGSSSITKEDGFIPIAPTFRLKADGISAFCVLDSTLYVFESSTGLLHNCPPRKTVRTLDLSSKPSSSMKESDFGTFHALKHPKAFPIATPTPDGRKILVFSSHFLSNTCDDESTIAGGNAFELYDPDVGKWVELPGIAYDWRSYFHRYGNLWVHGFTFIGTSTFVIHIKNDCFKRRTMSYDDGLIFSINLDSMDKGWERMCTFFGSDSLPFDMGRFFVIDDHLCVTPEGANDIKEEEEFPAWFSFLPESYTNDDDIALLNPCVVTLLDDDFNSGMFDCSNLAIGITRESRQPHFVINTFCCGLAKYKEDKEKEGSALLSKSIGIRDSLHFRVDLPHESFVYCAFFSF